MSGKRFKQVAEEGDQHQERRSASRHMAAGGPGEAGARRPRFTPAETPDVTPHADRDSRSAASVPSTHDASSIPASPRTDARFASASRATGAHHRFSRLGGKKSLRPDAGQVPVTTTSLDDGVGATFANDDAPRPIGVDPAATGAFHTITSGQGAVLSTRETAARAAEAAREALPGSEGVRMAAHHRPRSGSARPGSQAGLAGLNGGTRMRAQRREPAGVGRIALLVAGIVAAIVVVLLLVAACSLLSGGDSAPDAPAATTSGSFQGAVGTDQTVQLSGITYGLRQGSDGAYTLARISGSDETAMFSLSGTPVALVVWNGTFFIPENLGDGTWDVVSFMAADGAVASQLVGDDGQPVTGQGSLASVTVDNGSLTLVDSNGSSTSVPLS